MDGNNTTKTSCVGDDSRTCRRALKNIIHELRDKCAHIKTGGNNDLGIIGMDHADAKVVGAPMPLLIKIISSHISEKMHAPDNCRELKNPT